MSTKQKILISGFLLVICLSCNLFPTKERTYENEVVRFTIPAGWKTSDEIWNLSPSTQKYEYHGLGVQEIVTVQYPPKRGKSTVFFAVASSPLEEGEDLKSRFTQAYQNAIPEIEDEVQQSIEQNGLSGYEMVYKRPWGEPWWKFRDIWLEKDGMIYVLSFHASPDSFDGYADTFNAILESFQFIN